jgi:hypothetical protein
VSLSLAAIAAALGVDPSVLVVIGVHLLYLVAHRLGFNPLAIPLPAPNAGPAAPAAHPILDGLARLLARTPAPAPTPAPVPSPSPTPVPNAIPADILDQLRHLLNTPQPATPVTVTPGK